MELTGWGLLMLVFVFFAFTAWMFIDCLIHQADDKFMWVVIMLFLNFGGALLYFFIARRKRLDVVIDFSD